MVTTCSPLFRPSRTCVNSSPWTPALISRGVYSPPGFLHVDQRVSSSIDDGLVRDRQVFTVLRDDFQDVVLALLEGLAHQRHFERDPTCRWARPARRCPGTSASAIRVKTHAHAGQLERVCRPRPAAAAVTVFRDSSTVPAALTHTWMGRTETSVTVSVSSVA